MECRKDEVSGLCCGDCCGDGLIVTHFSYEDDIGIFTECGTECRCKSGNVLSDFSLVDHCLIVGIYVLDGVFDGDDVS